MLIRKKSSLLIAGIFICLIIISLIPQSSENQYRRNKDVIEPHSAATLEGSENILITKIERDAELSEFGVLNYEDTIEIISDIDGELYIEISPVSPPGDLLPVEKIPRCLASASEE